jgi:hypothetical protein
MISLNGSLSISDIVGKIKKLRYSLNSRIERNHTNSLTSNMLALNTSEFISERIGSTPLLMDNITNGYFKSEKDLTRKLIMNHYTHL